MPSRVPNLPELLRLVITRALIRVSHAVQNRGPQMKPVGHHAQYPRFGRAVIGRDAMEPVILVFILIIGVFRVVLPVVGKVRSYPPWLRYRARLYQRGEF